jgi:hypothetical protein
MTTTVPRPSSSLLVPTAVSGARPVPIGDEHTGRASTTVPEDELATDWQVRLAAAVALHKRRRELREHVRAELFAARTAGKRRGHAERLIRINRNATPSRSQR